MVFFKYVIEFFDSSLTEYGGHSQLVGRVLGLDYLCVFLTFRFGFFEDYYDGYHSSLRLGLFGISWGGKPLRRDKFH